MSDVTLTRPHCGAMVSLRVDLSAGAVRDLCTDIVGQPCPDPLRIVSGNGAFGAGAVAWMSPDELLLILDDGPARPVLARIAGALEGLHHLAADVSAARSLFEMSGPAACDILAKLTPADLSPEAFPVGLVRRTRLGQVPAVLWMPDAGRVRVACFRSVTTYVETLLTTAAASGPPGVLAPR